VRQQSGRNAVDAAYLRINPRGQVPTLTDGDVVLWGSTAILCYLARRYDESREWLPVDAAAMARVCQWLELAQNEIREGLFLARAVQRFGYDGDLSCAQAAGRRALESGRHRLDPFGPWRGCRALSGDASKTNRGDERGAQGDRPCLSECHLLLSSMRSGVVAII